MNEMESPKFLEKDRAGIEERVELKKKEYAESGKEFVPNEAAKEAVREYSLNAAEPPTGGDDQRQKTAAKFKDEPHAVQIEELMKIAEKEGIAYAVNVAKHLGNPHILDDFHDRLAFEFSQNKE